MKNVDITFNVFSDTPIGKDPDSYSPTLRRYHRFLWSKPLPCGAMFELDLSRPRLLLHKSSLGTFILSSDGIGRTFIYIKKMSHVVDLLPKHEKEAFLNLCCTIGGFMVFPSNRIDMKPTINGARGMSRKIEDRFDLTLECIRLFYLKIENPLTNTLNRYKKFFDLFTDFKGYVEYFLLQDLVDASFSKIKFWHPFESFKNSPLPSNYNDYLGYKVRLSDFVKARNKRIQAFSVSVK